MGSPTRDTPQSTSRLSVDAFVKGVLAGDRTVLSRAITLVESQLPSDRQLAEQLVDEILPHTGGSIRIGITGIPGVGKSTFIEAFGKHLTTLGKRLAVLAIDPSSQKTKGSILGDKTRMTDLSKDGNAFIRPTSAGESLGGVANYTRETILLCEAASFDVIIVETVGVGQSESQVRNMVDFFLLLMLGGAGDELQGIKKGIMEMADGIVITKADGDNLKRSTQAQSDFKHALHLFQPPESGWAPKVLISSAVEHRGIDETWSMIDDFLSFTLKNGFLESQRNDQNKTWFHSSINNILRREILNHKSIQQKIKTLEQKIESGEIHPGAAARAVVNDFLRLMTS
ncbi:MAG: methylmalonyl Co-A mutase-associated GTPase MeaB [Cyclobacteriaceae bacterium]